MKYLFIALLFIAAWSCKEQKRHKIIVQGVGFIDTDNIPISKPVGKLYEYGSDSQWHEVAVIRDTAFLGCNPCSTDHFKRIYIDSIHVTKIK